MKSVLGAALEVQQYLSDAGERFCFIGALAGVRESSALLDRLRNLRDKAV